MCTYIYMFLYEVPLSSFGLKEQREEGEGEGEIRFSLFHG